MGVGDVRELKNEVLVKPCFCPSLELLDESFFSEERQIF